MGIYFASIPNPLDAAADASGRRVMSTDMLETAIVIGQLALFLGVLALFALSFVMFVWYASK